jgi:O-antigen ligase
VLLALTAAATLIGPAVQVIERRLDLGTGLRRGYAVVLIALALGGLALTFFLYGSPQHIATRAYNSFKAPPVSVGTASNLNQRLFSLSSNGRLTQWRVALDDYRAHSWLGSGAGTYEFSWLKNRPTQGKIRDAHNLYLEVLAELGPLGLAVLVFALGIPIATAIKVRRHPLVPIALGAYVAFLVHAAVDWDWEMPAVTLAALLCAVAILVVARTNADRRVLSRRTVVAGVAATFALAGFAFVGLMGNLAIAASNNAAADSNWSASASHARDAKRWMPWSSDPWRLQGEAQYVQGNFDAARANFRKAIDKEPNNWLLWADLATVGTHGTWRAPARRALQLNPLAPELAEFRKALGGKG